MVPTHDYDCMEVINKQEIVEEKSENPFAILRNIQIADNGKE
jgi:predicted nucleic acid-binding Zn ribbon protein